MTSFLKALADFMEPVGFIWLVLTVLTVLMIRRRQWSYVWLPGVAWLVLTLTAASPLPHTLLASLETDWPPADVEQLPECDAIIVLGGGLGPSHNEPAGIHFMGGADRLFTGLMLARKGKGRLLLIGGGSSVSVAGVTTSEAESARRWVEDWKLSPVPVQGLGHCLDTHDEALKVSALAVKHGWKRVLLVTSAFHMTRSKAVFEKAGTAVIPVPCNYSSVAMRDQRVSWLEVPNAANLAHFEAWMHEILGWWAYCLRGWI